MRKPVLLYLKKNKLAFTALAVVLFMSLGAIVGPMVYPIRSTSINLESIKLSHPAEVMARKLVEDFKGSDAVMWDYFTLLTDLSPAEIDARRARFGQGQTTASELRFELAQLIVRDFHGEAAADEALRAVRARHRLRVAASGGVTVGERVPEALLDAVPAMEVALAPDGSLSLPRVVVDLGFAPSTNEAARQIRAGGVKIDGERAADLRWRPPSAGGTHLLTVGAKKIARLVLVPPLS